MPEASTTEPIALTPEHLAQWVQPPSGPLIKRSELRQEVYPEWVEMKILRYRGEPVDANAHTRDLSETGIGLTTKEEVGEGELVDLKFCYDGVSYKARAQVAHCTQTIGGYKVGLRFVFD
jgi:hypothetical protein